MDTQSSSFSVKMIARPPSRGTIIPARNAPTDNEFMATGKVHGLLAEDGMHPNDVGKKSRSKCKQKHKCHIKYRGTILNYSEASFFGPASQKGAY